MDELKVAGELVKMAKKLLVSDEASDWKGHKKAFDSLDRQIEKYDAFVRKLPKSSQRTAVLQALNALTKAYTELDGELYKQV